MTTISLRKCIRAEYNPSMDKILSLAEQHIRRYDRLIELVNYGSPNIRADECYHLLSLWKEIRNNPDIDKLGVQALKELLDALDDEAS